MVDQEALKNIENLHRMMNDGILTKEEFEEAKRGLLAGSKPAAQPKVTPATTVTSPPVPGGLPAVGDHLAWAVLPFKRYADFTGRSTRREYWMFMLLLNAVMLVLGLFVVADLLNSYSFEGPRMEG